MIPKNVGIARFALASYVVIPWVNVVIKSNVAKEEDNDIITSFIRIYGMKELLEPKMFVKSLLLQTS